MSEIPHTAESQEDMSNPIENPTPEQEAEQCLAQIRAHASQTNDPDSISGLQDQYRELHATMDHMEQDRIAACAEREGFKAELNAALLPPESLEQSSDILASLESITNEYFSILEIPGGDTEAGLENMNDYFSTLPEATQQKFLTLFQKIVEDDDELMELEFYFEDNGFINSETLIAFQNSSFGENFVIDIQEDIQKGDESAQDADESAQDADESAQDADESAVEANIGILNLGDYVRNMKSIIGSIDKGTIDMELYEIYLDFNGISEDSNNYLEEVIKHSEKISNYFAELASNPEDFARVLDSIGGSKNSELYQSVKAQVLSIPSSSGILRQAFDTYEHRDVPDYQPDIQIPNPGVATEVTLDMNEGIANGNTLNEQYDHSTIPPRRSLSLGDSDYQLDADLPIGEYYPATVEYTNALHDVQNITAVISYLEGVSNDANVTEVASFIESSLDEDIFSDLLILMGVSDLSGFTSVDELKAAIGGHLGTKKRELEEKLEQEKEKYEAEKVAVEETYKTALRERQEAQKEILLFLKQCGFDMIPKEITDMLIAEINRDYKGLELGGGTNLAQSIDIKNGRLGDERNDGNDRFELGDKEKEGFIRLVNIMTTGQSEGAGAVVENPTDAVVMNTPVVDTEVNAVLESNGVKSTSTGAWNINAMRNHLKDYKSSLGE